MIDLHGLQSCISYSVPSRNLIPVLVPMFLIISSSVYPAIMSSIENREMQIISKVMAGLNEKNIDTSSHHTTLPIHSSQVITHSSPTPMGPTFSTSHPSKESSDALTSIHHQEDETKMIATALNPGEEVHVLWSDTTSGNQDVLYKRDGANFDPSTVNLSNTPGDSFTSAIAVSGDNVYVVWEDGPPENRDIFYRRSIDGGGVFGITINLSDNTRIDASPAVAAIGNNVYVVWEGTAPGGNEIFYKRSTDGGASFTEPTKNLSNNAGSSEFPEITVSGNNVHVVWHDTTPGNFDIFYTRSTNSGSSFPDVKNLSDNSGSSFFPAIASTGNNVYVVWEDSTPGNADILYRRSINNGDTFPNIIKNLSSNAAFSEFPAIAAFGNNVHVVWEDGTGSPPGSSDTFYRRSINGGSTFPNVINNLSGASGANSVHSAIAAAGNDVHVVWENVVPGEQSEVVYRTSSDNGATFPALITNLSTNSGASTFPSIATS